MNSAKLSVFLILFIWAGFLSNTSFAQSDTNSEPPTIQELFEYKEVFTFEVKYGFLRLGEVEVTMMPDSMFRGQMHKHLVTKIVSNPKIPFIGTEIDHFHSLFLVNDDGLPITSYYWKDNIDEEIYKDIEYDFDRDKNWVTYKEEDQSRDTLELEEPATAGHVIFLFSRLFAGTDTENSMIVYVTKRKGYIHFDNNTKLEKRNYQPWDEPVQTYLTTGYTENIDGPFGFSGKFRAWFLDDELRVPLEARVKVLFGNALVRLIDYKKRASMTSVQFKKMPHANDLALPSYESDSAAGMDIRAALESPITLKPGERTLIPTGLQMALPHGYEAQIRPRSGLAIRNGITMLNSPGTIDADYRGEVKVIAINHGQEEFVVNHGDRIAQMVIAPVVQLSVKEVNDLDETSRGEGGFGSTGMQ